MDAHDSHAAPVPDDEPKTPVWLPILGGALFLVAGIWWATRPVYYAPAAPAAPSVTASAPVVAASSAAPVASAPIRMPPPMPNASNAQPVPRPRRH